MDLAANGTPVSLRPLILILRLLPSSLWLWQSNLQYNFSPSPDHLMTGRLSCLNYTRHLIALSRKLWKSSISSLVVKQRLTLNGANPISKECLRLKQVVPVIIWPIPGTIVIISESGIEQCYFYLCRLTSLENSLSTFEFPENRKWKRSYFSCQTFKF